LNVKKNVIFGYFPYKLVRNFYYLGYYFFREVSFFFW